MRERIGWGTGTKFINIIWFKNIRKGVNYAFFRYKINLLLCRKVKSKVQIHIMLARMVQFTDKRERVL